MQDQILLEVVEDRSESSTDVDRTDEKWSERNEKFLKNIRDDCLHRSNQHDIISHRNKKKYVWTAIPAMVLPLILANVSAICPEYQIIQPIGLTIVSVINGFQTLLNFSRKYEQHNLYSGKYSELAGEIDKVLIRKKKHRVAFDVCLERITSKKQNLDDGAPYVANNPR